MGEDLESRNGWLGGMHVATLKASTSLRMKKRGKVPPRLDTLIRGLLERKRKKSGTEGRLTWPGVSYMCPLSRGRLS